MKTFIYNDTEFGGPGRYGLGHSARTPAASRRWSAPDLRLGAADAEARALALVESIYPVGVRTVGPDVAHPNMIGDLKIVGPDVSHPNFIYWDKDSSSCPRQL
jgi:hypothetical protein